MGDRSASIYVAGHQGMVGSALVRRLQAQGYGHIVTRTRAELDLTDSRAVHAFLAQTARAGELPYTIESLWVE